MKSIFNGLVAPFLLYSLLLGGISLLQTFDPCVVMDTTVVNLLGGDTIWFIPCLILVEVLYVLISKFLKSKSNAVCIILAVVALFVTSHIHIDFNVWCWQTALFALGFYAYGHILKERLLNRRNTAIGVCTYIALCIIAGNLGWLDGIDMHKHRYGVPIVFLFLSTIGCVVCVSLIRFLPSAKLLVEFGRYTLFMFPFHSVILRHVLKVLYKLSKIPDMLLLLLAVTITSAICLFAARYIYRYVPALGGKKKWIK
jgi:fucose 4-O-acetylase-like acetyltransferase